MDSAFFPVSIFFTFYRLHHLTTIVYQILLLARDVEKPPCVNSRLVFMCASKYRCALCLPDAPIPSL